MNPLPNLPNLEFIKIPEDGSLPSDAKPVDFTIATYVTPWAMSDEKNKSQYSELISTLLNKEKAKLISVDPESLQQNHPLLLPRLQSWQNVQRRVEPETHTEC